MFWNIDPHIAIYTLMWHYIDPRTCPKVAKSAHFGPTWVGPGGPEDALEGPRRAPRRVSQICLLLSLAIQKYVPGP